MSKEFIIHINSAIDRKPSDLDTASWTSYLDKPIALGHDAKLQIRLENAELPNTCYTLPLYASSFWYILDYGGANTLRVLNLPIDRTFDATTFTTYINAALATAGYLLSFAYTAATGRFTITNNQAVPIRVVGSYRYNDTVAGAVSNNIADRLGFIADLSTTSVAAGSTLEGTGVCRFLRTNCYFITCETISNRIRQSQLPNPYTQFNIIGKMAASSWGTMSVFRGISNIWFNVSDKTVESLSFSILDDELQPITFNGSAVSFSVRCQLV